MSRISIGKRVTKRIQPNQKVAGDKKVFDLRKKGGSGIKGSPGKQMKGGEDQSRAAKLEDMFREDVREFAPVAVEFLIEKPRISPTGFPSDLCDPPIGIRILQQLFSYGRLEMDHPEAAVKALFPSNVTVNFGGKNNSQRPAWMQRRGKKPAAASEKKKSTNSEVDFEESDESDEDEEAANKVGGEEDTVYISNLQLPSAIQWVKFETVGRRRPVIMDLFSPVATVAYSHRQQQEKLQSTPQSKKKKKNRHQEELESRVYGVAASIMVVGKRGDDFRAKRLTIFPATPGCAVRPPYTYISEF